MFEILDSPDAQQPNVQPEGHVVESTESVGPTRSDSLRENAVGGSSDSAKNERASEIGHNEEKLEDKRNKEGVIVESETRTASKR